MSKEKNGSECCENTCICLGGCTILALIACQIAYIVFGIMYLVEDYDTWKSCDGSNLWPYALVALILSFSRISSGNVASNNEENGAGGAICVLICLFIIEASLATWGGFELYDKVGECSDLQNSKLWTFSFVTFILQVVMAGICFIVPVCSGLYMCLTPKKSKKGDIESNTTKRTANRF